MTIRHYIDMGKLLLPSPTHSLTACCIAPHDLGALVVQGQVGIAEETMKALAPVIIVDDCLAERAGIEEFASASVETGIESSDDVA